MRGATPAEKAIVVSSEIPLNIQIFKNLSVETKTHVK